VTLVSVKSAAPAASPGAAAPAAVRRRTGVRRRDRTPLLLVLLALALYLPAFGWGMPTITGRDRIHSWGNDDLVPLAPLAEMYNTFVREEPNRNVAYPWVHYALVAGAYSP
jgi:hypothetical protein